MKMTKMEVEMMKARIKAFIQIPDEIMELLSPSLYRGHIAEINGCYRFCDNNPDFCWELFSLGKKDEEGQFMWCEHCLPSIALKIYEKEGAISTAVIDEIKHAIHDKEVCKEVSQKLITKYNLME